MLNNKKKIIYISGTRADYGVMSSALIALNKICDLRLIATGMHLEKKFGMTINEIKKDKLNIMAQIKLPQKQETHADMTANFGYLVSKLSEIIKPGEFDACLVEADRFEELAMAIVAKQMAIPVFHQGGGDVSGSIDNNIRDAITDFSDYHFVGNVKSARRLLLRGIPEKRIFMFGEPGLDDIANKNFLPAKKIYKKYKTDKSKPLILAIQHPDTKEKINPRNQISPLLKAIEKLRLPTIIIYPNNDAGGLEMIREIDKYKSPPLIKIFPNLPRADLLGLMNVCSIMAGNSSSGLIETTLFNLPFINIGKRQENRLADANVINCGYNAGEIVKKIKSNIKKKGKFKIRYVYGGGFFTDKLIKFFKKYAGGKQ